VLKGMHVGRPEAKFLTIRQGDRTFLSRFQPLHLIKKASHDMGDLFSPFLGIILYIQNPRSPPPLLPDRRRCSRRDSLARRDQPPIRRGSPTSTPSAVLPGKKIPRTPDAASCASCRENRSSFISTLIVLSVSATDGGHAGQENERATAKRCPSLVIDTRIRGEMVVFSFSLQRFSNEIN